MSARQREGVGVGVLGGATSQGLPLRSPVAGAQASTEGRAVPLGTNVRSVTTQSFPASAIGDGPLGYGLDIPRTSSHQCKAWEGAHATLVGRVSETSEPVGFLPQPEEQGGAHGQVVSAEPGAGEVWAEQQPRARGPGERAACVKTGHASNLSLGEMASVSSAGSSLGEAWPRCATAPGRV